MQKGSGRNGTKISVFPWIYRSEDGNGVIALIIARQCDNFALTPSKTGPTSVLNPPYLSAIRVSP